MKVMLILQQSVRLSGPVVLALVATVGCSRPFETPAEGAVNESRAPFKDSQSQPSRSGETAGLTPVAAVSDRPQGLPFQPSEEIPAGTLLTVKLQTPIAVRVPIMVDSFEAVIEQPVLIQGNTLIPQGSSVVGHVESVFLSEMEPRRGYVGLVLDSIRIGEGTVPVQTSNLFARQTSMKNSTVSTIRLERGRRLTFRLIQPISLILHSAQASR
jgi:hypothetical protein